MADEQPDLSKELDFSKAITPTVVNALVIEQRKMMKRIITKSGPAFPEAMTKLHDRLDLSAVVLERGGFSPQDVGLMKLALAFMAKQVFIEVWRTVHTSQVSGSKKQTKKKKGRG